MNPVLRWYMERVLSRPILRAVDWTSEEQAHFDSFCRTSAGAKLFEFLRQIVAQSTFNAVYQDSVSANARARGMQDTLAVLHRLRVFPIQEESSTIAEDMANAVEPPPRSNGRESIDWSRYGGASGSIGNKKGK
jgi:hypothetical protein